MMLGFGESFGDMEERQVGVESGSWDKERLGLLRMSVIDGKCEDCSVD